jgi:hypothetical protein
MIQLKYFLLAIDKIKIVHYGFVDYIIHIIKFTTSRQTPDT